MHPVWLEQALRATAVWAREVAQVGKGILKIVVWVFLAGFALSIAVILYESYESHQPVDHDTPVWIQGDWLVGEYRVCQMRTKTVPPQQKELDSLDKLPRLFCGADSNGLFDFQRQTALVLPPPDTQAPPQGSMYLITVTADAFDSYFHTLPVRYFGSIKTSKIKDFVYDPNGQNSYRDFIYEYDRTDKWVISWRCQRNINSLTCNALD